MDLLLRMRGGIYLWGHCKGTTKDNPTLRTDRDLNFESQRSPLRKPSQGFRPKRTRLRHLLIKRDETFIGMLSIGDVIKACLQEKTREFEELHAAVSWEYYEEWRYPTP